MNPDSLHLTEDQLDDLLIGGVAELSANAAAHFASCSPCQLRFAEAEAPVASFRGMSLAWAERRSATLPLRPAASSHAANRLAWASLATAAAAVLAVAAALPAFHHSVPAAQPSSLAVIGHTGVQSVTPVAATPEEIARDNQMLDAIDQALDAPGDSAATFGLEPTSHSRAHFRHADVRD